MCSYTETFLVCMYVNILLSQRQINSLYKEHIAHLNFNFVQPKNKFFNGFIRQHKFSIWHIVLHILHMVQKSHEQQKSVDIFIELL